MQFYRTQSKDFIRNFALDQDSHPQLVLFMIQNFKPDLAPTLQTLSIHSSVCRYVVGFHSKLLRPTLTSNLANFSGWFKLVRIISTTKGSQDSKSTYIQYEKIGLFHLCSAKMGWTQILKTHTYLKKPIRYKWHGELPITFQPRWNEVWFP